MTDPLYTFAVLHQDGTPSVASMTVTWSLGSFSGGGSVSCAGPEQLCAALCCPAGAHDLTVDLEDGGDAGRIVVIRRGQL
jgi:hypothetical protein